MKRAASLAIGDLRSIRRDPMLLISIFAPVILAVVMKFGLPFVEGILLAELAFDLSRYNALIMSVTILISPMMIGMLSGFLILDERDENILVFYSVTPLSKSGYLAYRLITPTIISFILSFFVFYFINIVMCDLVFLIPIFLVCALESPLMALFLGAFAANKVEGLALSKGFGLLFLASIAGYFVKSSWRYLLGIAPTYWVSKAMLIGIAGGNGFWITIAVGALVHLAFIAFLLGRFENKYI